MLALDDEKPIEDLPCRTKARVKHLHDWPDSDRWPRELLASS